MTYSNLETGPYRSCYIMILAMCCLISFVACRGSKHYPVGEALAGASSKPRFESQRGHFVVWKWFVSAFKMQSCKSLISLINISVWIEVLSLAIMQLGLTFKWLNKHKWNSRNVYLYHVLKLEATKNNFCSMSGSVKQFEKGDCKPTTLLILAPIKRLGSKK